MDKRLAKRWACTHAAMVIDSTMCAGWDYAVYMSEDDADRATQALEEVIEELRRRGLTEDDPVMLAMRKKSAAKSTTAPAQINSTRGH